MLFTSNPRQFRNGLHCRICLGSASDLPFRRFLPLSPCSARSNMLPEYQPQGQMFSGQNHQDSSSLTLYFTLKSLIKYRLVCFSIGLHPSWLVVSTPLKYMKVNWDDEIPNIWNDKSHVPVTTNQIRNR